MRMGDCSSPRRMSRSRRMCVIRARVATLLEDHKLTTNLGGILPLGDSVTEVSICCHPNTPARRIPHLHLRHYRREKA
ncbi:hypothetical protein B0H13DRAFT_2020318, partial [Mycena leptocephala]